MIAIMGLLELLSLHLRVQLCRGGPPHAHVRMHVICCVGRVQMGSGRLVPVPRRRARAPAPPRSAFEKFVLVAAAVVPVCFTIGYALTRVPGSSKVL